MDGGRHLIRGRREYPVRTTSVCLDSDHPSPSPHSTSSSLVPGRELLAALLLHCVMPRHSLRSGLSYVVSFKHYYTTLRWALGSKEKQKPRTQGP